ncbi:hypothetical protein SPBR_08756 [Sporothrix brasiliensis 5110]|uniref:Proteinase inhibitor, propeptide n=1 Tax=Sporothrix brasiliensis 5110 TaxID=1398154 RepID=A0A0C2IH15_9PEZI|nr:uncharacterized protein SPBR_08756 [Sporothrix brasiliensis 5110]KIH86310.1 hypothetical protein SPBR_08756 [Sporothrix brasiliensis 5110]
MKPSTFFAGILSLAMGASAVELKKQVVVTYESNTPDWVISEAKEAIINAGGIITHEYNLIKGFAATAGEKVLASVQTMGSKYQALVEEDKVVSVE